MVNVLDVVVKVSHFLDLDPVPFCPGNADVTYNGTVDVLDVIAVVSIYARG